MKKVKTNLNNNIWVVLDENGLEILEKLGHSPEWYKDGDKYKFQIHHFMGLFGQTMRGVYAPFSMNVEIEIE